ncbi:YaiI/YqxD family protein [Salaquimonas pukyongi]|uniref:YaiI/YqxD family protein n=1 Tax=Salaquimonas pukyongi TaxID=2712698 RepID=UPI00096BC4F9|nr:YaiI/YqxD family protein [Salaquimonas pukyongi]
MANNSENGDAHSPTVFVDGDACPVKPEILKVAGRHCLPVVIVSNTGMRPSRDPLVRHVVVSASFDAADDWIAENAACGDVAVTADVPLAKRLVEKGVHVTSHSGRLFTPETIGMQSAMRNLGQELREAGTVSTFHAPFSQKDRSAFLQALEQLIRRAKS